jgi:rare lipoprotein A
MQKWVPLVVSVKVLFLVGCGGHTQEQPMCTDGTPCHPSFYHKAYNRPYEINGTVYYPQKHYEYSAIGLASYYGGGDSFHGRKTSNGEIFDMNRLSAAHKTVPIPCVVLVTNLENGRSLELKINDRGPFVDGRIIDVSRKAARLLGFERKGTARVKVETLVDKSIQLADNMARGHPMPAPFEENVMLARTETEVSISTHPLQNRQQHRPKHQPGMQDDDHLNDDHLTRNKPVLAVAAVASPRSAVNLSQQILSTAHSQRGVGSSHAPRFQQAMARGQLLPVAEQRTTGVFLQAGTFSSFLNAQALALALRNRHPHIPIKMQPVKVGSQQMFRVLIGPLSNNAQAQSLASQLRRTDGYTRIVVYK